ncbi:sarcosine oxidase subunit gamma family protein [Streptomyces sp. NPDC002589]|uniref:sarcosine oxidase subunit gamma family protein n=1 Tax=Streptomyces sp. NPDC002589 TaxID=3154420 RepID=UPI00332A8668
MADTARLARQRSPLGHVDDRLVAATRSSGGAVRLAEVPFLAQVNVRVDAKSVAADAVGLALGLQLPLEPDTTGRTEDMTVVWLGPDEWLVMGRPGAQRDLESRIRSAAGNDHVSVTGVSAQRTTLARDETRAGFWVLVRSSFAGYVADWLLDAAVEYRV